MWAPRLLLATALLTLCTVLATNVNVAASDKPRVVILTDITNEPDDQMSLVRFLTYADEFDVEGLIATTSCWKQQDPDLAALHQVLDAYDKVHANLLLHSPDYPSVTTLRAVTKSGVNGYGMQAAAQQLDNAGARHIISVLERNDPRPVWFCAWGGGNTLGAAVMKLQQQRPADAKRLLSKVRGYEIAVQDDAWAYIARHFPDVPLISAQLLWKGISRTTPTFNAWSESWGGNSKVFSADWIAKHVQHGHGALGEQYPTAIYLWEGDTPSFLYLLPNGLHFPEHVDWGGWGGRFSSKRKRNVESGTGNDTIGGLLAKQRDYLLFSDAQDRWTYGNSKYTNQYCTVFRWREDFQWDFAARMDRCIKPFDQVNHAPNLQVNGDASKGLIRVTAEPNAQIKLDAAASTDPDGDQLAYHWWVYAEPGNYEGTVHIENAKSAQATVVVPKDIATKHFHVVLTVTDDGTPALKSYRRIVIEGAD